MHTVVSRIFPRFSTGYEETTLRGVTPNRRFLHSTRPHNCVIFRVFLISTHIPSTFTYTHAHIYVHILIHILYLHWNARGYVIHNNYYLILINVRSSVIICFYLLFFRYQNELPKKIKSRGKDAHLNHEELVQAMKWKQTVSENIDNDVRWIFIRYSSVNPDNF